MGILQPCADIQQILPRIRIGDGHLQAVVVGFINAHKSLGRELGNTTPALVGLVEVLGSINDDTTSVSRRCD
jgi:hypothetical protein